MARDPVEERYVKRTKQSKLEDLARQALTKEEIQAEEEVIRKAKEERAKHPEEFQLKSGQEIGRNDPCPCGSGKKYKKCCGAK